MLWRRTTHLKSCGVLEMNDPVDIIIRPVVTEKTTSLVEHGKYVFEVHSAATKQAVAEAVGALFHVEVARVNVMNVSGKPRRFGKFTGFRPSKRKAIVTLVKGHTIDIYPGA